MMNQCRAAFVGIVIALATGPQAGAQTAPNPEALAVARQIVAKAGLNRAAVVQAMSAPLIAFMGQSGSLAPDRAKIIVSEGLLPLLDSNFDKILELQAQTYASTMSADDLKGLLAFYETTAGQDFLRAQPQLTQGLLSDMNTLVAALKPILVAKVREIVKAHGWDKPAVPGVKPG